MNTFGTTLLLMGAIIGCSKKSSGTYDVPDAVSASSTERAEADALWEQRGEKAQLQAAITQYEAIYEADPRNREVAARIVRGWYLMGDIHETDDQVKEQTWDTAIVWGKRCLAINTDFAAALEGGASEEEAAASLTVDDIPCMYWTATSLGKWARFKGLTTLLKHRPTVFTFITQIDERQPEFFYGAADRYWGAYYAALPSFAGQDLGRSAESFDASIENSPDYLGTRVLKAEYWAVKTQNRPAFEALLNEVVNADASADPDIQPENEAEQAKARALLANMDDLFAD